MVDTSTIKSRLRISHDRIDDQLAEDIRTAKAELQRVGISEAAVNAEDDPLIDAAIISYCLFKETSDEKMVYRYERQWNQWKDEIRKTPSYMRTENV